METFSPFVPPEQPRLTNPPTHQPANPPETPPAVDQTAPKQTPDQQPSPVQARSGSKPFNPYDMKALKQFDAGDHRAE
ncbi:hypothetical protein [Leptothoe sp. PORK10 BA2]|uniref:hypothetical protein n=1 Tax=Leptothoe sp. PORK10 BA2 TaxID=3110254 RepID=UPI002B2068CC|nr:hypothetical protein [Leptothoe sp. PORK10 BA2]MEA5462552.1 hypothetical protein [Leptothoe sp. PORK10 BA2]